MANHTFDTMTDSFPQLADAINSPLIEWSHRVLRAGPGARWFRKEHLFRHEGPLCDETKEVL